jgi:hypothetical protein
MLAAAALGRLGLSRTRLGRGVARAVAIAVIGAAAFAGRPEAQASSYTIVPGGPPVTVTTTVVDENADATFGGTAGQRVSLLVGNVTIGTSTTSSMLVSFIKPDGTALAAATSMGRNGGFIDTKTLPVDGTYKVRVDPQGSATGSATLTLYNVPADATAAVIPGGAAATVTTTVPGQNAKLTFAGTAGRRISLKVGPTCCTTKVSVLKPDGTTLVAATTIGTVGGFIDTKSLPVNGTYSIVVDPQKAVVGAVTVQLYDVPADVTGSISPGGAPVTVTTTTPGQNAKLTFAGTNGDRISLTVGPTCCATKISILKPDGTALVAATTISSTGGFVDVKTLPVSGTYSIVIDPQSSAFGAVTVQLYDVPSNLAGAITAGGAAVTVTTTAPGQNARLTFSGTAGDRISLTVGPTCCTVKISILKPDGTTLVAATTIGTAGGFIDTKSLPVSGTYVVVVDPQSSAFGGITIQLYDVPPDLNGPIRPGVPETITLGTPGQNGKLTFAGTAGRGMALTLSGVTIGSSSSGSLYLSIRKPDGTDLLARRLYGTSGGFLDTLKLPTTGTYSIIVDPVTFATGSITLTLYDVDPEWTGTITPGGASVARTLGLYQNGRVTFAGTAGRNVSLRVGFVPTACCTVNVSILNPDGTRLVAPVAAGSGETLLDARTLPVTGTYTIVVDPFEVATGTVTLTLFDVPGDVTTTATLGGPAVTVTTTAASQNGRVTFNGTAGDGVIVKIGPGNCCNVTVSVLKPDGTTLVSPVPMGTSGGLIYAELPVTGTYTVLIDYQSASLGSVVVQLILDNTPPATPTLSLSEAVADGFVQGTTFYYRPAGTGSVSVTATSTDAVAGVQKVNFPGLGSGFTPTSLASDFTAPYLRTYSWTAGATYSSATNTVTVYDNVGNTSSATFSITPDSAAPTTTDNTAALGSAWKNTNQTVTLTPSDGTGSGVAATYYTTTGSTPTNTSPSGTSISLTSDGVYTIKYFSVDNVSNTEAVKTAGTQIRIDKTAPSSAVLNALPAAIRNGQVLTGSGADALSGVASLSYLYCAGSACTPSILIGSSASGPSYSVTWASQPADGTYQVLARVTDTAGNTRDSAKQTIRIDNSPPTAPTITVSPTNPSNSTGPSFSFTGEAGASFQCALDGAAFAACTSPRGYTGLAAGPHTFQVRQTDAAGNTGPAASYAWTIDTTAPLAPTITSSPAALTNSSSASFSFTGEAGATFSCQLDGGGFASCTSPKPYAALPDGSHTFQVRQTDAAGNTGPAASFTWTVDSTAPAAPTITASPSNPTNSTSASFSFTGEGRATFPCQLDGGGFSLCTSPKPYSGLLAGSHTFQVHQTDTAGNMSANASYTWTIDTTAPAAPTITASPNNPTNSTSASFSFSGEGSATFACQLDGGGFSPCTSPKPYSGLLAGLHTFHVRQTDAAGNTGPQASFTWAIDTTAPAAPTITSSPNDPTSSTSASFSFSGEGSATFACRRDGGAFTVCTSPMTYTGLGDGAHTFNVRQTDAAGNTGPSAAAGWTVDTTPPAAPSITSNPANPTSSTSASFSFSGEGGGSYECKLDAGGFSGCTSPEPYASLGEGSHTFQVRQTDGLGNTGPAASFTWTVDTVAPDTSIDSSPSDPSPADVSFSFSSTEPGSTFTCSLDGGPLTTCASPESYNGLLPGLHTFDVWATDAAGNTDATEASFTWTVT